MSTLDDGESKDIPNLSAPLNDWEDDGSDEVTALHDFIAGGLAGSASVVVGHPFDTIKVRLQTSQTNTSLLSLASSFGGVSSLFRGMGAPLGSAALVNAIIFSSYGMSSRFYDQYITNNSPGTFNSAIADNSNNIVVEDDEDEEAHEPWQKSFLCGSFAGLVQCAVICPMEHIKCRLQVQHGRGAADNLYNGPIQATTSILKNYGISGLFRGWWTTTLREVPAFGLYFTTYDYIKDNVNNFFAKRAGERNEDTSVPGQLQHSHAWLASALAGGTSGCFTWAIVYPVDVIKTRIQTSPLDTPVSFLGAGRQLVAQHGWRIMFRGLGVTLVRAFPVNGTVFPVYEWTLKKISDFGI